MQQFQEISLQQSKSYNYARTSSRTALETNKQSLVLDKLKKQNQYLKGLISRLAEKQKEPKSRPSTAMSKTNVNNVLKEMIDLQKTEIKKLDEQILTLKKQTWSKKTPEVGVLMERQLKVLETRLDKGTHKLNDTLAQIQQQKKLIDNLRRQKAMFQTLYNKLEKELNQKRKQMANIIQKANQSYEERDRMTTNINSIKQQARKETFDFQKQLKQLSLLTQKSKIGQYSVSTRRPLSSQQIVERPKTAKKKQSHVNMKRLQKLRQDFKKIQGATQISNFSQLIKIFLKNQEDNYIKFKNLNQKAYEIQALQEELSQLNKQVKSVQQDQNQPDKRMQQATQKLQSAEKKQDEVYTQQRQISNNLSSLLNYVDKMYNFLFKDSQDQALISQTNVMMYLQKIEQKAALINNLRRQLGTETVQKSPKAGNSPKKLTNTFMFDNYLDDDEEYDKILTHEDFMKKASERFSKSKDEKPKRYNRK